jgi:hypothetical protein
VSPPDDRVAVPTNGHRRALTDEPFDAPSIEADFGALDPPAPTVPAFTPGQLIAGFGIIAALILLILGRRRGRRD